MAASDCTQEQSSTEIKLDGLSMTAWNITNILSFMAAAIEDDTPESLPIRCTIINLHEMSTELAENLMNLSDEMSFARRQRAADTTP
jgi:hypothetical protein